MKLAKILCVSAVALAGVSLASAQIRVTGSTAFRKAVYNAVVNSLNSPVGAAISSSTSAGTDMTGANQAVISGTLKSGPSAGQTVTFEFAFAGSVGGMNAVTNGLTVIPASGFAAGATWINGSNGLTPLTVSSGAVAGAHIFPSSAGVSFDGANQPVLTMSDSFQSSTDFQSPALTEENSAGNGVGVVDFNWVKSANDSTLPAASYNAVTNLTTLQAQSLLANGLLKLSELTGNSADSIYDALLVGRNNDSGTRLDAEAESGFGFDQTEAQFQPNTTTGTITSVVAVGNNGYASGGSVAAALNRPISGNDKKGKPFIFIGYLGKSDTGTATGGATPGVVLTYNGSSNANSNITSGVYTFWSYEHAYYLTSGSNALAGVSLDAVNLFSNQLRTSDATLSGTLLSAMNVSRLVEGGTVN